MPEPAPSPPRDALPPDPTGWYHLGRADGLKPGELRTTHFMGEQVVLYRTASGEPRLVSAWCPHLGAHLGKGGDVVGEHLRCPFHHFEFDGTGACARTAYGHAPPKSAQLRTWPVITRTGMLFAWHERHQAPPQFDIPELDTDGWTPVRTHAFHMRSHPQETTENSVDIGHFTIVHGFSTAAVEGALDIDGPVLKARYSITVPAIPVLAPKAMKIAFTAWARGLGHSYVEVDMPDRGMRTRQWVLSTPTEPGHMTLTIGQSIHIHTPGRVGPGLGLLPHTWLNALVGSIAMREYTREVANDVPIWENKVYIAHPAIAKGDGPIGRYRAWCRQFTPSDLDPRADASEAG